MDKLYDLEARYNREMEKLKSQFEKLQKEGGDESWQLIKAE